LCEQQSILAYFPGNSWWDGGISESTCSLSFPLMTKVNCTMLYFLWHLLNLNKDSINSGYKPPVLKAWCLCG